MGLNLLRVSRREKLIFENSQKHLENILQYEYPLKKRLHYRRERALMKFSDIVFSEYRFRRTRTIEILQSFGERAPDLPTKRRLHRWLHFSHRSYEVL